MALKSLSVRLWIVLLLFPDFVLARHSSAPLLENCRTANFDLLLIADGQLPSTEEQTEQLKFFSEIPDLFLLPEESEMTRLKVAFVSITSSGPVEHFSFLDYNKTAELKQAILNTSVVNFTAQTSSFLSTARPTNNSPFQAFAESEGGRHDANRVVVIVISNYTLEAERERVSGNATMLPESEYSIFISQTCDSVYNPTILYAVIWEQISYWNVLKCLPQYSSYRFVSELSFDDLSVSVGDDLCHELGRFHDESLTISSWYYVHYVGTPPRTWYEMETHCTSTGGELASIETQEEADFVISRLRELFIRANYWLRFKDYYYMAISIGLQRDRETVAARFHWRNGNPLVLLSHWLPGYPNGDLGRDCGMWDFRWNPEEPESPIVDGFVNRVCGTTWLSYTTLCEAPLKNHPNLAANVFTVPSANRAAFTDTLHRGAFMVLDDSIVSVTANIQDLQFLRVLQNSTAEFPIFSCEPGNEHASFVPYSYVCDHKQDCVNRRDETICLHRECDPYPDMEFTCESGQCVPAMSRCDLIKDCYDGSDEQDCATCSGFMCPDGKCLPMNYYFDGEKDCTYCDDSYCDEGGPDEEDYWSNFRSHCAVVCNHGVGCVYHHMMGNGVIDCIGPEGPLDEQLGQLHRSEICVLNNLPIWSPWCVYVKDRYSGLVGCRDMSHLGDCQNFTCPEGYVKCPESYCIPLHYILDGNMDCPLGEDERNAKPSGCKGNFACWGSKVCLHPDLVCDGSSQCPSGDDELDCNETCADGFRCIGGTVTVNHDFETSRALHSLSFISPLTRYLDLSGVDLSFNFTHENQGQFYNLIELRLSGCKLGDASGEFAADLHRLRTVYLVDVSYNLITEITDHSMFSYMSNLHHLDLSHNKLLTVLPPSGFQTFSEASSLQYLDLSDTAITKISQKFLQELTFLNTLNLSGTNIRQITENTFPDNFVLTTLDLRQMALLEFHPDSLKELTVHSDFYTDSYTLCCPQIRGSGIPEHICHAPEDAVSSCLDLVRDRAQRILLWLVGILALLGNVVVIIYRVVFDSDVLKKSYGLFVTNLSMADLLMGIYLIIIAGTDVLYRGNYVLYEKAWRHSALCQTAGFLSTLSSETSAFFIFLVTVDRYLVIKFPFGQHKFSNVGIVVSCAAAWCAGFVLALIPVLPAFSDWTIYSSSGMCLGLPLTTERPAGWGYSVAVFIVLNFIMFVIIACGQYLIYKAVSDNRMTGAAVAQNSARRAQDIMIAKQLSLVALSDFLCWFPIGFMGLLALSGHEISEDAYTWSAVLVLPVNSALNPLLYTVPVLLDKWEKFKKGNLKSTGRRPVI